MGLYDRDYTHANYKQQYYGTPPMRIGLPRPTSAVKTLLMVNGAVFALQMFGGHDILEAWFAVHPTTPARTLQLWRLVGYQFLHADLWHILFNMLFLYFVGPILENHWGRGKFVAFYLACGAVGGLLYPLLRVAGILTGPAYPLIGASGAVLATMTACAILFPHLRFYFWGIFPLPLPVIALLYLVVALMQIFQHGPNAGGEAAHLGGMAAGAAYVFTESWRAKTKLRLRRGFWKRKVDEQRKLRSELDRILDKVHHGGLHSLTPQERRTLKKATRAEQQRTGP